MKVSSGSFLHFIFLCLFNGYFSSNSDSTIVESPKDNDEINGKIHMEKIKEKTVINVDLPRAQMTIPGSELMQSFLNNADNIDKTKTKENEQKVFTNLNQPCSQTQNGDSISTLNPVENAKKVGKLQMEDGEHKMFISFVRPRALLVKYMVPENIGSEHLWREVSSKRIDRTRELRERTSRLQMEENEEKASTIFDRLLNQTDNPESVRIQSPDDNVGKLDKMQMEQGEQRVFISLDGPNSMVVIYMTLEIIGSERLWREVYKHRIDQTQGFTPAPDIIRRSLRPDPWDRNWTTERSIIDFDRRTPDYNRPQKPENKVTGNDNNDDSKNSKTTNPSRITEAVRTTEAARITEFFEDDITKTIVTKPPGNVSPDSILLAGIVNDFAFKLMEKLDLESNFVISPLSIFIALSMCYLGSDGQTKTQMEKVLGMDNKTLFGEHFHQGIKDILTSVTRDTPGDKLLAANGMFLAKNFVAEPEFKENIRKFYDAEIKDLDFGNPMTSQHFLNTWVSENTRNTITSILNSPPPVETRLILLNAIYFKGMWKTQFPPHLTRKVQFQTLDGNFKEIEAMRIFSPTFPVFKSDDHQHTFMKLPYKGDQLSMILALPYTARLKPMPSITDKIFTQVRNAMEDTNLGRVDIPKFRIEYRKSLLGPLRELGLTDIFDRNSVNLSKLRKDNDVFVSAITHKALVEVNEAGTTASGSTADSFTPLIYPSTNFVADHPFAFYIVHEPTGLVLFYGKMFDVESGEDVPVDRTRNEKPRISSEARPRFSSERRRG